MGNTGSQTSQSAELSFRAPGKLLLTGEYFVLDGALALALPARYGQSLRVRPQPESERLKWRSYDADGRLWFEGAFAAGDGAYLEGSNEELGRRLQNMLQSVCRQNPEAFSLRAQVTTHLEFPRQWGLGASSTLLVNLAHWSQTDPYRLLQDSIGGSGYDLACGLSEGPILFQRRRETPQFVDFPYYPPFASQMYFVYLGQKQNSREGIAHYREKGPYSFEKIQRINNLTRAFTCAPSLEELEAIIRAHEAFIATTLDLPTAKAVHFPDYWGEIKSLGAWGGDFILATSKRSEKETRDYFRKKGREVVIAYQAMAAQRFERPN